MKLLIVTSVAEFQKEILNIFKKANIEAFSRTEIDGYKNTNSVIATVSWFPGEKGGNESLMFFSFTENEKIELLFDLVSEFNENLETNNPIRVAVVNIENYI
ncbi:hypothetical protein [Salegentibacter salegens]|uniref:Nitrogen regulatory protein P-II family n=1 Tax=Salegentibacter salegens TaxID=143223 RepID=A0A1M7NP57_9FLAO|nr:hypothetical protein [Salegentibacter salegens]PRX43069.1 hypothetical protein LY58_02515 [Salegentibacter salegens]SHN05740.1 hypothetical protein SAMN05878281_3324 [Salegentibacter salegens]